MRRVQSIKSFGTSFTQARVKTKKLNPLRLRSLFGPPKPLQRTVYQEISNQMGTYFVYVDISNTAGNLVRGIGTLDREIRCISVQIMHE